MKTRLSIVFLTTTLFLQAQPFGGFVSFDGKQSYLKGELKEPLTENFTVEFFMNACQSTNGNIIDISNIKELTGFQIGLNYNHEEELAYLNIAMGNGKEFLSNSFEFKLPPNRWTHVAFVHTSSRLGSANYVLINGEPLGKEPFKGAIESNNTIYVGVNPFKETFFNGQVDAIRISNEAKYKFSSNRIPAEELSLEKGVTNSLWLFNEKTRVGGYSNETGNGDLTSENDVSFIYIEKPEDIALCEKEAVVLTVKTNVDKSASISWTPKDNLSSAEEFEVKASPEKSITYTYTLNFGNRCTFSDDIAITIGEGIKPEQSTITGCIGDTVTLKVSGADKYEWSNSEFLSCTNCDEPKHVIGKIETFTVQGFTDECESKTSLSIKAIEYPRLTIKGEDIISIGGKTQLLASGADTYEWDETKDISCTVCENPTVSPSEWTKYTVTGTNSEICSVKRSFVVNVGARISGTIFKGTSSEKIAKGEVAFLVQDPETEKFKSYKSVDIQSDGSYNASLVPLGLKLFIQAAPDKEMYPTTLKTYHPKNFKWENANQVMIKNDTVGLDINCIDITPPSEKGKGRIWGKTLKRRLAAGKVASPGDPFNGVDVSLIDKSTNTVVQTDQSGYDAATNDSAIFAFEELQEGTYNLYVDVAGVSNDLGFDIGISESTDDIYVVVIVDDDSMSMDTTAEEPTIINTSVLNPTITNYAIIYPNPVFDQLQIQLGDYTQISHVSIYDLSGKLVLLQPISGKSNTIPVSDLRSGMYLVEILGGDYSIQQKIFKQ